MIEIRSAEPDDLAALLSLNAMVQDWHSAHYPDRFRENPDAVQVKTFFKGKMADSEAYVEIAYWSDAPAGYAFSQLKKNEGSPFTFPVRHLHMEHIAVAPAFRRQGIATKLLENAVQRAKSLHCTEVNLTSWALNTNAHAAFETAGFVKVRHLFANPV